jgi:aspartyl-tRNA(Asn)/glutamyl-tRNA(Gln) amidotransferase subunit A
MGELARRAHMAFAPTRIDTLSGDLRAGRTSSRALVEQALGRIADPAGEGTRTFVRVHRSAAIVAADVSDRMRREGIADGLIAGIPVSVKDLFDIAGEPTPAGSLVLAERAPAVRDARVVSRLREAGAVIVGRTNMTEFAFSGIGINPHYGTPRNPYDRATGRIPGGSSSGAAVSVVDGMAAVGIGTDTGGSVRIPAALCGLTGFKPTARRVPLNGALPLSTTLDSIGPIAPTVSCCALLDSVLSGESIESNAEMSPHRVRLGILQGYPLDGLDAHVSRAFEGAVNALSAAGVHIEEADIPVIEEIKAASTTGGFSAAESYAWHRALIERDGARYDPRVASRILRGAQMLAADYIELIATRRRIIGEMKSALVGFDALLLPTVPRIAPPIAELQSDDRAYLDANAAMLRNTSIINFIDGCALSMPCHRFGEAPVGLMVAALGGHDRELLSIANTIERVLAAADCAIWR